MLLTKKKKNWIDKERCWLKWLMCLSKQVFICELCFAICLISKWCIFSDIWFCSFVSITYSDDIRHWLSSSINKNIIELIFSRRFWTICSLMSEVHEIDFIVSSFIFVRLMIGASLMGNLLFTNHMALIWLYDDFSKSLALWKI